MRLTDFDELPGGKFVKDDVLKALNIKKGTASADANLFKIECTDQKLLEKWIKNPESKGLKEKFSDMSINMLKEWKVSHSGASSSGSKKLPAPSKGKGKERQKDSRKRGRNDSEESGDSDVSSTSDSNSESEESHKGRRGGKMHKRQKRTDEYDSDDLDN